MPEKIETYFGPVVVEDINDKVQASLTMRAVDLFALLGNARFLEWFRWSGADTEKRRMQAIGFDRETETLLVDPDRLMAMIRALNPSQPVRPIRLAKLVYGREDKPELPEYAEQKKEGD